MDVFDLYAKISLDSKGYEKGLETAKSNFDGFKTHLGDTLKTVAKLTGAAVSAGATAVGKVVKDAVSNYGEYQQLTGGVETLFKTSAKTVQENAEKAFSTAQISSNQYMDLVTSFSASLIQSTGRGIQTNLSDLKSSQKEQLKATKQTYAEELKEEKARWDAKIKLADKSQKDSLRSQKQAAIDSLKKEQAERLAELEKANEKAYKSAEKANNKSVTTAQSLEKAAKLSDLAVIDMADNANKMGTNMESIQNAYQGFAKQNFMINLMSAA